MTRRLRRSAIVATGLLLAVSACGSSGSTSNNKVDPNGTFNFAFQSDPGSVSPYLTTGGAQRHIFAYGYDTLISVTPEGEIVSNLAEDWKVSPSEVVFTLRKGVTCDDGSELTASDVADDFKYIKDPKTVSPWRGLTIPVEYSVSADAAARTLSIKTDQPFGLLLRGAGSLAIVCPAARANPEAADHAFLGTGPYQVKDYVAGDHYTLEKRPGYDWGPDGATTKEMPKNLVISFTENPSTAASQLLTGEVNATQLTGPQRDRVEKADDVEKASSPAITGQLLFNEAKGRVLTDINVRKALAASLDLEKVAKIATAGRGTVAKNLVVEEPVLCPGDETTGAIPAYNVEAANKFLDDAGWEKGSDGTRRKDGKPLELDAIYKPDTNVNGGPTMEYIAQQWEKVGIRTNLRKLTNSGYGEVMYSNLDFDVSFSGLNIEMPFMLTPFFSGPSPTEGGRNSGSLMNRKFDSLSAKALSAKGDGCDLWNAAHVALFQAVDTLPLAAGDRPFYVRGGSLKVVGLHPVPTSLRLYAN